MTAYPAVTIWQPWATLIVEGCKPFEFRRWCAPRAMWGKRIAIHAGARMPKRDEVRDLIDALEGDGAFGQSLDVPRSLALLRGVVNNLAALPLSSVLGLATLDTPWSPQKVGQLLANDSDRSEHFNWGWPLKDIERFEPFIPARGAQGFWTWTRAS
jgi:hypothetical protein